MHGSDNLPLYFVDTPQDTDRSTGNRSIGHARIGCSFEWRASFLVSATFFVAMLTAIGCGESQDPAAASVQPTAQLDPPLEPEATATVAKPTEIVSQFLDRVRRGGDNTDANALLTKLAQQEMTRIGRPLAFPGSPNTRFDVHDAYPVPNQENTVWVPTVLVEPLENGQEFQFEVVWTVRRENDGWRISGFTTEGEDEEPMQINFENGAEMEARLSSLAGEADQKR